MKKIYSLIKACMTSDMNIFKINNKKSNKGLIIFLVLCFMFSMIGYSSMIFEKLAPLNQQKIVLTLFVLLTAFMTIVEGIYKAGPLLFNCKDDNLLLSLPISKRTVLFVRLLKFYIFELLFNSIFMFPVMIAYVYWTPNIEWTYYLVSLIMLFILPIIPIVISCLIGALITSISSRFKYKNIMQIVISMIFLVTFLYASFRLNDLVEYLAKNATSINDIIMKLYYPAGVYINLISDFSILELLKFILINIIITIISILILSKFYFSINSRIKTVTSNKNTNIEELIVKSNSQTKSLMKKELNTFFKTPVFIINAGLGLLLYLIVTIAVVIKFDGIISLLTSEEGLNISKDMIMNNISIYVLYLIIVTSFMTSITNSVISLEGRNINILKSLPVKIKTILMSKIYSSLLLTTPVLFLGVIVFFIKFKLNIFEVLLLLILSILLPLVSHFIGILVNLKYPKLDAESSAEVVKQSMSSFLSVMIGMLLLIINILIISILAKLLSSTIVLLIVCIVYIIINILLYLILINKGVKLFNDLTI